MQKKVAFPNVLVVAHNSFSDTLNNGKTLSSFFNNWPSEKLSQIFLTTDVPDFSVCKMFFQITDFVMIRRFFLQKNTDGIRITENNSILNEIKEKKADIKKNGIIKIMRLINGPTIRLLRDLMWELGNFRTKKLIEFVNEINPDVVFFQTSSGVFAFKLVKWITKKWDIPLLLHTTDDYIGSKITANPFFWIMYLRLNKNYRWATNNAIKIFTISELMLNEYRQKNEGNYSVALNSVSHSSVSRYVGVEKRIKFVYAGNLGLNRWRILHKVCIALDRLQKNCENDVLFEIYSMTEISTRIKKRLSINGKSVFNGAVSQRELSRIKDRADVLIHVEAFDRNSKYITRLSVSTKIPEYLSSGRCILAIGPRNVASMDYLIKNKVAVIVSSKSRNEIERKLLYIINDKNLRVYYANRALEIANQYHNHDNVRATVQNALLTIDNKK